MKATVTETPEAAAEAQPAASTALQPAAPQTAQQPAQPSAPRPHLGYVDSLRALAALYVVMHHGYEQIWPLDYFKEPHGLTRWWAGWLAYGHFSVSVFIVISGFCLMLPVLRDGGTLRGGAKRFFKRRARRILPPYYLSMLLSLALIATIIGQPTGTHWDRSINVRPTDLISNLIMLQDVFGGAKINHVYWSIAVECQIYLLFPLLLLFWRRLGPLVAPVAVCALACVLSWLTTDTRLAGLTTQYLGLFALGMFGAAAAFSADGPCPRVRNRVPWMLVAGLAGAAVVAICSLTEGSPPAKVVFLDFLVGIAACALLVGLTVAPAHPLRRALDWGPLVFVGTFSYSLYLIHAPLLQVVWQETVQAYMLRQGHALIVLLVVATPIVLGAAYLFHLIGERPFMNSPARAAKTEPGSIPAGQAVR